MPFSSRSYIFTNYWRSNEAPYTWVVVGREGAGGDPEQGVILIREPLEIPSHQRREFRAIRPLEKTGALEITGATGKRLDIRASDSTSFKFDAVESKLTGLNGEVVRVTSQSPSIEQLRR